MRLVVIGAGGVGSYVAERLAAQAQDVVVIETDDATADELQAELDCLVIKGNGTNVTTLKEAGVADADLFLAVTNSDAANILAVHAAAELGAARRIARVEDPLLRDQALALGADAVIDPDESTAQDLLRLVSQRGVSELIEFGNGQLELVGGFIAPDAPVAGLTLTELRAMVEGWSWVVVAVIRGGETLIARGPTKILPGDHVIVMAETDQAAEAFRLLGIHEHPARKVIVCGTTRGAVRTAELLAESGISTTLIDPDRDRVAEVAEKLPRVVCIHGDPTEPKVLRAEGIDASDAILALSGWDDVNILVCLVAKALGVGTAVARLGRFDLVRLLPGVGIDGAVSPKLSAANEILRFVRQGDVRAVVTFQDSDAEAIELQVRSTSAAAGRTLAELKLPRTLIIGGVIRGDDAFVPTGDTRVQTGDRLVIIAQPDGIPLVERLFG